MNFIHFYCLNKPGSGLGGAGLGGRLLGVCKVVKGGVFKNNEPVDPHDSKQLQCPKPEVGKQLNEQNGLITQNNFCCFYFKTATESLNL